MFDFALAFDRNWKQHFFQQCLASNLDLLKPKCCGCIFWALIDTQNSLILANSRKILILKLLPHSLYHPRNFRNYFQEWFLTGHLTIEGSTELNDSLLSDIIYPTIQKWFYSNLPRNLLCHWKTAFTVAKFVLLKSLPYKSLWKHWSIN